MQDEIRHFKRTGRANRIVTLIVRGGPEYGDVQTENQCFPEVLRFAVDENGMIDFSRHDEALAADARLPDGEEGYTSEAAYREALQRQGLPARQARQKAAEYAERLNLAKLKIVSTILGVALADLTQRDQAYQLEQVNRKNRTIKKVAAVMALLAADAGFIAWQQKNAAQRHLAQSLYISGINKLAQNEYGEPAAYIAAAVRAGSRNAAQLAQSLLAAKEDMVPLPNMSAPLAAFSPDGRHVVGFANQGDGHFGLQIWDVATRTLREEVSTLGSQNPARPLFDAHNRVYVRSDAGIARHALDKGQTQILHAGGQSLLAVSADGRFLVLRDTVAGALQWLDTQTLSPMLTDIPATQAAAAAFSEDGRHALLWTKPEAQPLSGLLIAPDTSTRIGFPHLSTCPSACAFPARAAMCC